MCGIFGILGKKIDKNDLKSLALLSRERGKDSSGFLTYNKDYIVRKFNDDIKNVLSEILPDIGNLAIKRFFQNHKCSDICKDFIRPDVDQL